MQLSAFQDGLSAALLGHAVHVPWVSALESQPGFAVYSNTVLKGGLHHAGIFGATRLTNGCDVININA